MRLGRYIILLLEASKGKPFSRRKKAGFNRWRACKKCRGMGCAKRFEKDKSVYERG